MKPKECKDCDNYTDGICCQTCPKSQNTSQSQLRAEDAAFDNELVRLGYGALVTTRMSDFKHENWGNC